MRGWGNTQSYTGSILVTGGWGEPLDEGGLLSGVGPLSGSGPLGEVQPCHK